MKSVSLKDALKDRILVLDGAMGTMVQSYALCEEDFRGYIPESHPIPLKGNNDLLVLGRPDVIREIHTRYLVASTAAL